MGNRFGELARRLALACAVAGMGLVGDASATLIDRGGGLIYDDVLNITWLQNANYAATELSDARRDAIIANVGSVANTGGPPHTLTTSDFQKSGAAYTGRMTWWGAMAWSQDLVFGGYSDWRLAAINLTSPSLIAHDCNVGGAAACALSGNELGYMYEFDLDGTGNNTGNQTSGGVTLNSIQPDYWSGTEFLSSLAWGFRFGLGGQNVNTKLSPFAAWAVRPGDVVAPAPEPASLLLIGVGVVALRWSRRKGRRH